MTKYIIKNCPSLNQARNLCNEIISTCYADYNMGREVVWCKYCTDCLLKRIVEKCVVAIDDYMNSKDSDDVSFGMQDMATTILSMLEIEECDK